jgi:hypothetical protein
VATANAALLAAVGLPPEAATAALGCDGPDDGVLAWARVAAATPAELSAGGWSDAAAAAVARARGSGQPVQAAVQQLAYNVMGSFIARVSASNEAAALQRLATCAEDGALLRAAIAAAAAAAPGATLPPPPSDADVRWAAAMLLSRAFYLEDVHELANDADSDEEADVSAEEDDEGDSEFASYSTLALVPWADRCAPRFSA